MSRVITARGLQKELIFLATMVGDTINDGF